MLMLLLLISPTVYTIAIFQPGSVYIVMLFFLSPQQYIQLSSSKLISNNNIKIYTEQDWKMTSVYTVGESRNNIKIYTEQGWKMAIVYTVGEISNKIKIYQQYIQLPFSILVL
jgi:hypothetical protein